MKPVLRIWVNPAIKHLRELYETHIEQHNKHISEDPHPNSGFDLFVPENVVFYDANKVKLVNHGIKAAMYDADWGDSKGKTSCAYYLYPRSSIYKTSLILANSTGIIDSGYRGWVCSALCFLPRIENEMIGGGFQYELQAHTKLTQICHPSLLPFTVELVDDEAVLETTVRGDGGFGSTGR